MAKRPVAVLISGSGSNLQALINRSQAADASYEIVHVLSNVPSAFGLERARKAGITTSVIPHGLFADRSRFDAAVGARLAETSADYVCLAGFMRILGPELVQAWHDRMLNVHPSLLPSFKGLRTHARALAAGVRIHGCTVHIVRPALDDGPILVQGVVPVRGDDDPASLAARVVALEHQAYPLALDMLAGGHARITGDTVQLSEGKPGLVLHPELS